MEIKELITIAEFLQNDQAVKELQTLEMRANSQSAPLTLPLVGEFSAGKTSLLNAITDSKKLETATKPTTATIYELHFGSDRQYATILDALGQEEEVEDIASLSNDKLGDVPLIRIYDTSTRVPRDLVLVDTPGLSSPDQKHKDVLMSFLPQADAILLVIDSNQQLTRSLIEFIEEANKIGRKVYLIVTKCDTKHPSELEAIKSYIATNCKLPLEHVVGVSATAGQMDEFYALIDKLTADKREILASSIEAHKRRIAEILRLNVEELIALPNDAKGLEQSLDELQDKKRKSEKEVDRLVEEVESTVASKVDSAVAQFRIEVFDRLDSLLASRSANMTAQANSILSTITARQMSTYRSEISRTLSESVRKSSSHLKSAVARIDLEGIEISSASIDFDISQIGHEYDTALTVGIGTLAAAAIAVAAMPAVGAAAKGVAATAGTAGSTVAGGAAVAGAAKGVATTVQVLDTATDVASIGYMMRMKKRLEKGQQLVQQGGEMVQQSKALIEQGREVVSQAQQALGTNSGASSSGSGGGGMLKGVGNFFVGLVGQATEALYAKPQRRRAINECIENQLVPHFAGQMEKSRSTILGMLHQVLQQEVSDVLTELETQISGMKETLVNTKQEYKNRINLLKQYKEQLTQK